jgi:DNA polymerase I-like protein with 3'-5' exonuclease and polymerase domains
VSAVLPSEQLPEYLDAQLVIACHDELLIECPYDQGEEMARFVEKVMVAGMGEVVNPGLYAEHPDRVPIEVDVKILKSWGND